MARQKRNSSILEKAERRLESLRSIDVNLDLGGDLTIEKFNTAVDDLADKLAIYNTSLSKVDKQGDDVKVSERIVNDISEKMLLGVASRYGKNSQEYEMAGGRRRNSHTSRPVRRAASPDAAKDVTETVEQPTNNGAGIITNPKE